MRVKVFHKQFYSQLSSDVYQGMFLVLVKAQGEGNEFRKRQVVVCDQEEY